MVDMSRTIIPKSDQLNADDLIAGPRTVRITRIVGHDNAEQPVSLYFEGDNGKPYKPCKGMRRALVYVWGPDGDEYVGRTLTLFHDPNVTWAGEKVGGIRISHMSHIREAVTFPLSVSRTKRTPWTVEPVREVAPERKTRTLPEMVDAYCKAVEAAATLDELVDITSGDGVAKLRSRINESGDPGADELLERMTQAGRNRHAELSPDQADPDDADAPDHDDPDGLGMYADPGDDELGDIEEGAPGAGEAE